MIYTARTEDVLWADLSSHEIRRAADIGRMIWEKSHEDGRQDRDQWSGFTNGDDGGLRQQMLGALAERAAAKALDVYWPESIDGFSDADLGHNIEVRLIGAEHYGLRVYPRTVDSRRVVGVVIPAGKERGPYRLPGWIVAGDAKKSEWEMAPHGRPPMFAVPQTELRYMRELLSVIGLERDGQNGDYWVFPKSWSRPQIDRHMDEIRREALLEKAPGGLDAAAPGANVSSAVRTNDAA